MNRMTRRQRAEELYKRLKRGPSFDMIGANKLTPEEASRRYHLWAETGILDDLVKLVRELQ